jgi:MOSC domain-containing protein YiiM
MTSHQSQRAACGKVASLHLHPAEAGTPFRSAEFIELVAGKGIAGNPRYFNRPSRRQVTLIEREQIAEHAAVLGLPAILPGVVRSNIETEGIDLAGLMEARVRVGEALLLLYAPRTPCHKMDAICPGLRALMENGKQGVLAQVIESGRIAVGDRIEVVSTSHKKAIASEVHE